MITAGQVRWTGAIGEKRPMTAESSVLIAVLRGPVKRLIAGEKSARQLLRLEHRAAAAVFRKYYGLGATQADERAATVAHLLSVDASTELSGWGVPPS